MTSHTALAVDNQGIREIVYLHSLVDDSLADSLAPIELVSPSGCLLQSVSRNNVTSMEVLTPGSRCLALSARVVRTVTPLKVQDLPDANIWSAIEFSLSAQLPPTASYEVSVQGCEPNALCGVALVDPTTQAPISIELIGSADGRGTARFAVGSLPAELVGADLHFKAFAFDSQSPQLFLDSPMRRLRLVP